MSIVEAVEKPVFSRRKTHAQLLAYAIIEQIGYTYDARGQRIGKSTLNAYPEANESGYTGAYDSANRLTSIATKRTGAPITIGGPATDETFTLTSDQNGNLVKKVKLITVAK